MSYWVNLTNPHNGETLLMPEQHDFTGGTYAIGGTDECTLNVTYNYSAIWSVRKIEGKTGRESLAIMLPVFERLKDDADPDYWKATEGNVKIMLAALIAFANAHPDGVWEVH